MEIVPTIYMEQYSYPIFTHQYSVTNHTEKIDLEQELTKLPGTFHLDLFC